MSTEERKLSVDGHVYRYGLVDGTRCWYTGYSCKVAVDDETERLLAALSTAERERDELQRALGDVVVKCIPSGTQDGDFVLLYKIPTGPIHHAIPLLDSMGITVRPGFDGRARVPSGGA